LIERTTAETTDIEAMELTFSQNSRCVGERVASSDLLRVLPTTEWLQRVVDTERLGERGVRAGEKSGTQKARILTQPIVTELRTSVQRTGAKILIELRNHETTGARIEMCEVKRHVSLPSGADVR